MAFCSPCAQSRPISRIYRAECILKKSRREASIPSASLCVYVYRSYTDDRFHSGPVPLKLRCCPSLLSLISKSAWKHIEEPKVIHLWRETDLQTFWWDVFPTPSPESFGYPWWECTTSENLTRKSDSSPESLSAALRVQESDMYLQHRLAIWSYPTCDLQIKVRTPAEPTAAVPRLPGDPRSRLEGCMMYDV